MEFPQPLVDAYLKWRVSPDDEKLYTDWVVLAKEYIGKPKGKVQYSEGHMQCQLIVQLASAFVRGELESST